ncbi:MAG: hypothetical protein WC807_20075 [Hyphomicrobium sp.]|jgi:hypothetical protein
MIELVLYACLVDNLSQCKDVNIVFTGMTSQQCMAVSPAEVAKWTHEHPKWVATRWTCRSPGRAQKV